MFKLIEDLNLMYWLKNDVFLIERKFINLILFFKNVIEDFKKNLFFEGYDIFFVFIEEYIEFVFDEVWFR